MYKLFIGNQNYSSWSLRPWVLMQTLGIEFEEVVRPFESNNNYEKYKEFSPSGKVPCLEDGEILIWDSLAICEYLADSHKEVWPESPAARAFARCVAAEMHSSFSSLRSVCPMNCGVTVKMKEISTQLQKDIDRVDEIFCEGIARFGGPFLAGKTFTAADAFYCPVAYRIKTYQLPVSETAQAYVNCLLELPSMQKWYSSAIQESWREEQHEKETSSAGTVVEDMRKN